MRRGILIAAVVALLLTVALWLAAKVERSALTRSNGDKRVPSVVAGRDLAAAQSVAPVREADEGATVRCRYDGEDEPGTLVAMGDDVVQGGAGGADLSLRLPPGTWSVMWRTANGRTLPLGAIDAEAGEVYTCRLGDAGWEVRGRVLNEAGRPLAGVDVSVCGDRVRSKEDGTFSGVASGGSCKVRAIYTDGLLARRSEVTEVGPFLARDVALVVDDAPIAGMGIAFRMADAGATVLQVHPGTPAEEAGLASGDLIVSVDGTRTAGLSDDAFIALGTGPEGSRVALEIERDGERRTVRFNRERLQERLEELGTLDTGHR